MLKALLSVAYVRVEIFILICALWALVWGVEVRFLALGLMAAGLKVWFAGGRLWKARRVVIYFCFWGCEVSYVL